MIPFGVFTLAAYVCATEPAPAHAREVTFVGGYPSTSKTAIYPLAEVKVGDRGIGYTVFSGAEVEPFDVEIIGILRGMLGPSKPVILARLTGQKIEFTGVISGMSGSPVYIDGRLVGAVSYRFGAFAKEAIAGITPIETMLEIQSDSAPPPLAQAQPVHALRAADLRSREARPLALPERPKSALVPIDTPIVLGGFSPSVAAALKSELDAAGLFAVAGEGAGSALSDRPSPRQTGKLDANGRAVAGGVAAAPIAPGSPIAAVLMRGDMFVSAVGTVTYVENGTVLGFGHPFFGYGHVRFPMATASVLNTLAALPGSYKQAAPALEVGTITHDRLTAIGGNFHQIAPMIPIRVNVRARGADKSPAVRLEVEVVDHEVWTPLLLKNALASAGSGRLAYESGGSMDVTAHFQVGDRTLTIEDTYAAFAPTRVGDLVANDLAVIASLIVGNAFTPADLKRVDVEMRPSASTDVAWLESLTPARRQVSAGERLRVMARIRPYRGEALEVPLEIQVPVTAAGDLELYVGGAVEVDRRDGQVYGDRLPRDLDDLLAILGERRAGRGLYARTYLKRAGLRSDADLLSSLPVSHRAILAGASLPGRTEVEEAFGPAIRVESPFVIIGGLAIILQVSS